MEQGSFALQVDTLPEARLHLVLGPEELPARGSIGKTPVARLLGRARTTGASGILVVRDESFMLASGRPVSSGLDPMSIAERLVGCLAWCEGPLRFERDRFGDPGFTHETVDLRAVLTAGVAAHYGPGRLARELPITEEHHVYPGPLYDEALADRLGTLEKIALAETCARPTVAQLGERLEMPFEALHRLLFVLYHLGAIGFDLVCVDGAAPLRVNDLRHLHAIDPTNPEVAAQLALALYRADPQAHVAEAGRLASDARELDPTLALPYVVLGMILERVPDPDGAAALFRHAVLCDPASAEARSGLARLTSH